MFSPGSTSILSWAAPPYKILAAHCKALPIFSGAKTLVQECQCGGLISAGFLLLCTSLGGITWDHGTDAALPESLGLLNTWTTSLQVT